jgi:hypothetical protein
MSALLLTAPAVEPLSLTEAKAFLRVEHNDDDELIAALAAGSRIHVETQTRRALITQRWRRSDSVGAAAEIHSVLRDRDRGDYRDCAAAHRRTRVNRAALIGVVIFFAAIAGFLLWHSDKLI